MMTVGGPSLREGVRGERERERERETDEIWPQVLFFDSLSLIISIVLNLYMSSYFYVHYYNIIIILPLMYCSVHIYKFCTRSYYVRHE